MQGRGGVNQEGTAALMLDISKCYERIPLVALAERAMQQGWPGTVVRMAIRQYAATRWVAVAGAVVNGGRARRGMIPGCAMAVKLLGSFLHEPLTRALSPEMRAGLRTYVDDLRIVVKGSVGDAGKSLQEAFKALRTELEGASECVLQPSKCVALGSSAARRQELAARFRGKGVQVPECTRDLGCDSTQGNKKEDGNPAEADRQRKEQGRGDRQSAVDNGA